MKQYACKWYEGHMRNLKRSWKYFELNKNENQFNSVTQSCPTLYDPMDCSMPGLPVHHQLPGFTETHVHWVGDAIQSSHLLSSPSPFSSVFPSIRIFSIESALCIMWSKYWSFSISPSNEYSRLISFRIDWFDLLAVPWRIPKSLHQHHSSKASILWHSLFFLCFLLAFLTPVKSSTGIQTLTPTTQAWGP